MSYDFVLYWLLCSNSLFPYLFLNYGLSCQSLEKLLKSHFCRKLEKNMRIGPPVTIFKLLRSYTVFTKVFSTLSRPILRYRNGRYDRVSIQVFSPECKVSRRVLRLRVWKRWHGTHRSFTTDSFISDFPVKPNFYPNRLRCQVKNGAVRGQVF